MKLRKTMDVWDIETNSGYGWESECVEYTLAETRAQEKCYRENSCGRYGVRLSKHREKITRLYYYGLRKVSSRSGCFPAGAAGHSVDSTGAYKRIIAYGRKLEEPEAIKYDLEFIKTFPISCTIENTPF